MPSTLTSMHAASSAETGLHQGKHQKHHGACGQQDIQNLLQDHLVSVFSVLCLVTNLALGKAHARYRLRRIHRARLSLALDISALTGIGIGLLTIGARLRRDGIHILGRVRRLSVPQGLYRVLARIGAGLLRIGISGHTLTGLTRIGISCRTLLGIGVTGHALLGICRALLSIGVCRCVLAGIGIGSRISSGLLVRRRIHAAGLPLNRICLRRRLACPLALPAVLLIGLIGILLILYISLGSAALGTFLLFSSETVHFRHLLLCTPLRSCIPSGGGVSWYGLVNPYHLIVYHQTKHWQQILGRHTCEKI